jgi:hypothetical protein
VTEDDYLLSLLDEDSPQFDRELWELKKRKHGDFYKLKTNWGSELNRMTEREKIDNNARTGVMSRAERLRRRGR